MPPFTPEQQRRFFRSLIIETIGLLLRDILRLYLAEIRRSYRDTTLTRHRRLFATEDEEEDTDDSGEETPQASTQARVGFDEVDSHNGTGV